MPRVNAIISATFLRMCRCSASPSSDAPLQPSTTVIAAAPRRSISAARRCCPNRVVKRRSRASRATSKSKSSSTSSNRRRNIGPEYLTYVMWAVTPEGRATNLGEVLLNGTESKLNVTTELQAFGLIVTAEPYFAVSQPSDVVVMENYRPARYARQGRDGEGALRPAEARHVPDEHLGRSPDRDARDGSTRRRSNSTKRATRSSCRGIAGADRYAGDTWRRAEELLARAEEAHDKNKGRRTIVMAAREAAQTAEDSRLIALQRQEEERIERERDRAAAARSRRGRARAGGGTAASTGGSRTPRDGCAPRRSGSDGGAPRA